MANEKIIKKAKELGIENAEALNETQLEKAIKQTEASSKERNTLLKRAKELGFDEELFKDFSNEDLKKSLSEAEEERALEQLNEDKAELISEFLGLDVTECSLKDLKNYLDSKIKELSATPSLEEKKEVVPEGKTDKPFKAKNGMEYVFTSDAPEKFRFADVVKTQKEWLEDSESYQLMIDSGVSYVKILKK
ncbi:hypothetical protein LXD69_07235 [Flavobacterium sediminilitoris]|uniref:Phage protein n=1 Tax=Flavobacterium sediminilitoris TaxID=2024526 RepID=A0ABY4HUS3_9FLAO|nr:MULTISPECIES: hypothetical protein [Flavobacterium]UOX35304.1 hypothetical protein LXD69_07235 [Flavobacterium sediminilitoris]